jgi:hypothetical protein
MRAEYDSDVNALSIDVLDREHLDVADPIDEWYCRVGLVDGKPANVELLDATDHLDLLGQAAERHNLDADELDAIARAAIALPDRVVTLEVAPA